MDILMLSAWEEALPLTSRKEEDQKRNLPLGWCSNNKMERTATDINSEQRESHTRHYSKKKDI